MADAGLPEPSLPDPERTVIRPRPGARSAPAAASYGGPAVPPSTPLAPLAEAGVSSNPILAAAQPLLQATVQLRSTPAVHDVEAVKDGLSQAVGVFERQAAARGVAREDIIAARYVLCTFADEVAAGTPWGGGGSWARGSLLVRFHNEASGGEKVFLLLSKLAERPAEKRDLLELILACLSLGFEGRYRVLPDGRSQLMQLRDRLFDLVSRHRPPLERALAAQWQPADLKPRRLLDGVPVWALVAIAAVAALGSYALYNVMLSDRSDPVFASMQGLRLASQPPARPAPVQAAPSPRLSQFLQADLRQGTVTLQEDGTKSVITITGDTLFEPGSAVLSTAVRPVLERVADGLAKVPGRVLVSGHTDDRPIRTARFPSNWHLSNERAAVVVRELSRAVKPDRLRAEGRAENEPIAPNDTPAGRARNRRVEIVLYP